MAGPRGSGAYSLLFRLMIGGRPPRCQARRLSAAWCVGRCFAGAFFAAAFSAVRCAFGLRSAARARLLLVAGFFVVVAAAPDATRDECLVRCSRLLRRGGLRHRRHREGRDQRDHAASSLSCDHTVVLPTRLTLNSGYDSIGCRWFLVRCRVAIYDAVDRPAVGPRPLPSRRSWPGEGGRRRVSRARRGARHRAAPGTRRGRVGAAVLRGADAVPRRRAGARRGTRPVRGTRSASRRR